MDKKTEAIANVLEAIINKFGQQSEESPIRIISPSEFTNMCADHGIDHQTAYDLATFAVSLVRGIMERPGEVTAIVGGCKGGTLGGELIVQVESLKV